MASHSLAFTPSPIQEAFASTASRNKSHEPASAGASFPTIGSPLLSRFTVRFESGPSTAFLRDYSEAGVSFTDDIQEAKLFKLSSSARFLADFFHAELVRVVTDARGRNIRLAILEPRIPQEIGTANTRINAEPVVAESSSTTAGTPLAPLAAAKYYDSPAKQLFVDFLERYLEISFIGFQSGYTSSKRTTPDLLLFRGPTGSTLAVPISIMLEGNRETALGLIRQKITEAEGKFRTPVLEEEGSVA